MKIMIINVNQITQEQFDDYLKRVVECAFREGSLWEKCGGEEFLDIEKAIQSAQLNILCDGHL